MTQVEAKIEVMEGKIENLDKNFTKESSLLRSVQTQIQERIKTVVDFVMSEYMKKLNSIEERISDQPGGKQGST